MVPVRSSADQEDCEIVVRAEAPVRLDRAIVAGVPGISRGEARRQIAAGSVFVNGRRCRGAAKAVRPGDRVRIAHGSSFDTSWALSVLFEDDAVVAVDKPAGVPAAPTRSRAAGTASERLSEELRRRSSSSRLWVVHRLDTPTSGVMIFARTKSAAAALSESFREQRVRKHYLTLVSGIPREDQGRIALPVLSNKGRSRVAADGSPAITEWWVRERRRDETLVELVPLTGRMHQLRVHMRAIGHAIVGDRTYGGRPAGRLMLHAWKLTFPHPATGCMKQIEAPPPVELEATAGGEDAWE